MNRVLNKESGYALIVVLLVIIIIAIMTPPIISKIMSSSTQFQKIEVNMQLEKLLDMGKYYSDAATNKAIEEAGNSVQSWIVDENNNNRYPGLEDARKKFEIEFTNRIKSYISDSTIISVKEPKFVYKIKLLSQETEVTLSSVTVKFQIESVVKNNNPKIDEYTVISSINISSNY